MPCNAVVYLPATIRQFDTTAMFANSATHTLTAKMLEATLTALLNNDSISAYDYGTNLTVEFFYGTIRIWQDGRVTIVVTPMSATRRASPQPFGRPSPPPRQPGPVLSDRPGHRRHHPGHRHRLRWQHWFSTVNI